MGTGAAFLSLLMTAQTVGVDLGRMDSPAAVPTAVPLVQAAPQPVLRLALADISRDQERAAQWHPVGRGQVGFVLALGPEDLWAKLRQGDAAAAWPLPRLEGGADADFPVEPYRFLYENGNIRALPLAEPQSPQAIVSVPSLLRGLYDASLRVLFTPVEYSVLYEDGALAPASITLLREDREGRLWATYKPVAELGKMHWFLAIDGVMFGMKLEGPELVFYSQPVPAKGFQARERRLD